jgi:DNA-binding NarL/FixJ family response regulator
VSQVEPRVALVDHQMPGQNGIALTAEIRRRYPDTMVVMVTATNDDRLLVEAIEAGCSGFLTKDRAVSEVVGAVKAAAAGEALISPALLARLLPKLTPSHERDGLQLTDRERQLLELLAKGGTNKAIAEELFLSVNTVRNYVQAILTKLGAHSKLEAVSIAVREGLIGYPAS